MRKKSWERRVAVLKECFRRTQFHNPKEWLESIELVGPTMKGKSNTQKRKYIIHNVIEMAAVWQTGYAKLPDYKKRETNVCSSGTLRGVPRWLTTLAGCPSQGDFVEYFGFMSLTDHLSTIVEGLDEYYHCRRTECGCITSNATWPNTCAAGGGQYWCPDPKLNCMYQYRADATTQGGVELMKSTKVMVCQDIVREPGRLRYQYCEWGSAADEIMKEEIKAIVHDMQDVIKDHGWVGATRTRG